MKESTHLSDQKRYFNKDYSKITKYTLYVWQKEYLSRMYRDFLKKEFKNKLLVDIAAGSGYVSIEMAKKGLNVLATDISEEAIKKLKMYKKNLALKNLKITISKAEKISLPDLSADYIIANAILEHIPQEKATIKEWLRILKPGGRLFITVPVKYRYIWPFLWPVHYVYDKSIGHLRRYNLEDLQSKFRLRVLRVYYTGHLLKMIGGLLNLFMKDKKFDSMIERQDSRLIKRLYGATNISVIFEK